MTIANQVKQTLASLKGTQVTLDTFASVEENSESKALLEKNSMRIKQITGDFENRVKVLEFEEPQYKGF